MEGDNKMVTSFKGIKSVTELNGDTITNVSSTRVFAIPVFEGRGDVKGEGQLDNTAHAPSFPPRDLDLVRAVCHLRESITYPVVDTCCLESFKQHFSKWRSKAMARRAGQVADRSPRTGSIS